MWQKPLIWKIADAANHEQTGIKEKFRGQGFGFLYCMYWLDDWKEQNTTFLWQVFILKLFPQHKSIRGNVDNYEKFFNGEDNSEAVGMTDNSWCHNFDCEYKSTLLLYLFIKIIVLTIDDWSHGPTVVPTLSWPQNELSKLIIIVVFL